LTVDLFEFGSGRLSARNEDDSAGASDPAGFPGPAGTSISRKGSSE